jgi:hypothetical protein
LTAKDVDTAVPFPDRYSTRTAASCRFVLGVGLDPPPVRGDGRRGLFTGQLDQHPDLRQRHPDPPRPRDDPGRLQLSRRVPPVAVDRIHDGGPQQAELVVEAQSLGGQAGSPGELADGEQFHGPSSFGRRQRVPCPLDKVNLARDRVRSGQLSTGNGFPPEIVGGPVHDG